VSNSTSEGGLSIVRKVIEEHVPKGRGPTVLFEALSDIPDGEDIPRTIGALSVFVAGPLAKKLHDVLGPEKGAAAVLAVKAALKASAIGIAPAPAVPSDIEVSVSDSDWPDIVVDESIESEAISEAAEKRPTLTLTADESTDGTVRVMVIAGTARLAQRIRAAFGGHRVTVSFGLSAPSERHCWY
jgi:hypothetical protein